MISGKPDQQGGLLGDQPGARVRRLYLRARHPTPRRRQLHGMKTAPGNSHRIYIEFALNLRRITSNLH